MESSKTITVVHKNKPLGATPRFYCGRPTPLGNPFPKRNECDRDRVCDKFAAHLEERLSHANNATHTEFMKLVEAASKESIELSCFCAPKRCHCDEIKNKIEDYLYGEI
jgi:hypothetical protein